MSRFLAWFMFALPIPIGVMLAKAGVHPAVAIAAAIFILGCVVAGFNGPGEPR
jgi:hypothetical protein